MQHPTSSLLEYASSAQSSLVSDKIIHDIITHEVEEYMDNFIRIDNLLERIKTEEKLLHSSKQKLIEEKQSYLHNIEIFKILDSLSHIEDKEKEFVKYGALKPRLEQIHTYIKNNYPLCEHSKQIKIKIIFFQRLVESIDKIEKLDANEKQKVEKTVKDKLPMLNKNHEANKNEYLQKIINIQDKYVKQLSTFKNVETEITNYKGTIFALSDIHGDLHAFIIALRDCAKVICKKDVDEDDEDEDIDKNLNIDISVQDNSFDETFGYEWCGNNTCVVICGDIIDPVRPVSVGTPCKKDDLTHCLLYPQIEIKLLRFINAMNKKAKQKGCRIFKLLGNHEIRNISIDSEINNKQYEVFRFQPDTVPYYHGVSRREVFHYPNPGYKLLFEDSCYTLLKINGSIFAHGQIPTLVNLEDIKKINNIMNNYNYFYYNPRVDNWLMDRDYANPNNIANRLYNREEEAFCSGKVKEDIKKFLGTENIDNIRVIIGHCPQINTDCYLLDKTPIPCLNRTYKSIESKESNRIIYNNKEIYIGDGSNERIVKRVIKKSFTPLHI